jgi:N-acetyl-gamma-glutamyl-phosphate reductase
MKRVAIYGASGYGGQELLRFLAGHPGIGVAAAFSGRWAGRPVSAMLPALDGFHPDLRFRDAKDGLPDGCDGVFLAVPHGAARALVAALPEDLPLVDLSTDFRAETDGFVYGLTEMNRTRIRETRRVANPGCFATGALLALAPLAGAGALRGDVVLAQTTGSSGSGAHEKPGTHHPERAQDHRAYKVLAHQHETEIRAELGRAGAAGFTLAMIPQSGCFSRGIFTAAHVHVDPSIDVAALFAKRYAGETFVRQREETPAVRHVARTNFCDFTVHAKGGNAVVLTAIDNLGKGMAGQAIQNMTLLLGLDEAAGLRIPGANP